MNVPKATTMMTTRTSAAKLATAGLFAIVVAYLHSPQALIAQNNSAQKKSVQKPTQAPPAQTIPTDPKTWQEFAQRASILYDQGKAEESLKDFSRAIELQPNNASLWYSRCQIRSNTGDLAGALADANKSLSLKPAPSLIGKVYASRGACLLNQQRFDDARKDFDAAIRLDPKLAASYLYRGILEGVLRRWQEAVNDHTMVIKLSPPTSPILASAYYERGNARMQIRDFRNAIADYNEALERNQNLPLAYLNRGNANAESGFHEAAVKDYATVIANTSNPVQITMQAYTNRSLSRITLNDYAGALQDCDSVLARDPRSSNALFSRATVKKLQKNYLGGIADLTQILKNNPQDVNGFLNATSLVQSQLSESRFDNATAFFNRAGLRLGLGDTAGACLDWTKAIELGNLDAADVLVRYYRKAKTIFEANPQFPSSMQLFPRNNQDSATLDLSGMLVRPAPKLMMDSVVAIITKNGAPWKRIATWVGYGNQTMTTLVNFTLQTSIHAELSQYNISLRLKNTAGTLDTLLASADSVVCGDVILVNGQSNAILGSTWDFPNRAFARTYKIGYTDNNWALANAANEDAMGGIGGIGLRLAERVITDQRMPVCVINGAVAASTIEQHASRSKKGGDPSTLYGRMFIRAQKAGLAASAKMLVWYQGESNPAPRYLEQFAALHKAWHEHYPRLQSIYVAQIHPSICSQADQAQMRDLQRRLPATFPDVQVVATAGVGVLSDECHFTDEGYKNVADGIARLMQRDFYGSRDTVNIASPALQRAYFTTKEKTEIALVFSPQDSEIAHSADSEIAGAKRTISEAFTFRTGASTIVSLEAVKAEVKTDKANTDLPSVTAVRTQGNVVFLTLKEAAKATQTLVSYVPNAFYEGTTKAYIGPWLLTKRGAGVLTFDAVPVEQP
jgi:tetratricopeptide (TPR) repeat protein